ncbi:MAG: peptidoglycan-binding protein LysM [Bacteroidetes bacterium HGW-Bacteroidetes-2]|nr:MAG: peptidoglycan-binding protein LysM [Bacteroidetes bacterium HGW-Bacteroidetes-2]
MKKISILLLFFLFGKSIAFAQTSYQSHYVKQGETVFSITKKYNISEEELYRLNPEVKNGLKNNTVLIIPTEVAREPIENITFKDHRVKRKETLFSISQVYGVTVDDIKKHNKHLYSSQIKKGENIKIPIRTVTIVSNPISANKGKPEEITSGEHVVENQETKFGIAKIYGISVAELEALNPVIYGTDILPLAMVLNVPKLPIEKITMPIDEEEYTFYTVKSKEGFYRLKILFGVTQEEVIQLNPEAKDGLKEGMVVKIPKKKVAVNEQTTEIATILDVNKISIENRLTNFSTKNVVVFLPFELNNIIKDSISQNENQISNSASLRIALDFYSGVLIAADFAKQKGISVNLHIFDTEEMELGVNALFNRKNIKNVDVVLGPLRQVQVERVAADLEEKNIPVLSPLSNRQSKMYSNFIQSIPSNTILENAMISFIRENSDGKNIILIADGSKSAQQQKLQNAIPGIILINPGEGGYLKMELVSDKLSKSQENWVILESKKATLVNSVVSGLNGLRRNNTIRLFTLDKNDSYDFSEISNLHLARLSFTFPSVSKIFDYKEESPFVSAYKEVYGTLPNRFAARGFDITYDMLLRLACSESIFETNDLMDGETSYLENKFNYKKNNQGGYYNTSVFILKYNEDLKLEEVK